MKLSNEETTLFTTATNNLISFYNNYGDYNKAGKLKHSLINLNNGIIDNYCKHYINGLREIRNC